MLQLDHLVHQKQHDSLERVGLPLKVLIKKQVTMVMDIFLIPGLYIMPTLKLEKGSKGWSNSPLF